MRALFVTITAAPLHPGVDVVRFDASLPALVHAPTLMMETSTSPVAGRFWPPPSSKCAISTGSSQAVASACCTSACQNRSRTQIAFSDWPSA